MAGLVRRLCALGLRLRLLGFWLLVYGYCGLCAAAALLRLGWSFVMRPSGTFRWTPRDCPPPCLSDTSLGTHCYVRIKVTARRGGVCPSH